MFLGGVARSRSIFLDPETGWYTPFWTLESGGVGEQMGQLVFRNPRSAAALLPRTAFIDRAIDFFF